MKNLSKNRTGVLITLTGFVILPAVLCCSNALAEDNTHISYQPLMPSNFENNEDVLNEIGKYFNIPASTPQTQTDDYSKVKINDFFAPPVQEEESIIYPDIPTAEEPPRLREAEQKRLPEFETPKTEPLKPETVIKEPSIATPLIQESAKHQIMADTPDTDYMLENSADEFIYPLEAIQTIEDDTPLTIDGMLVNKISFSGLNKISPDTIASMIKTKPGSVCSTEVLQEDLQSIYATGSFTDKLAVNPTVNEDRTIDLVFDLHENIVVSEVNILGNTVVTTAELQEYTNPLLGKPQNIEAINNSIEQIKKCYHEKGYVLADVSSVDDDGETLILRISEGVVNSVILDGNKKTKDYVIERNMLTLPGTVYNEEFFKKDLANIYATNLFKKVDREIIPVENGEKGEYDIKVKLKESSSNNIVVSGGVDSALGVFGSLRINENNLFGRGQRLSIGGLIGSGVLLSDSSVKSRINYQADITFVEPYFLNADNSLMSKMYIKELGSYQVPLAIEQRIGVMANLTHKVKNHDELTTNLAIGFENIHLREGDANKIAYMYALNNINFARRGEEMIDGFFFNIAPGMKYSTLDTEENPREGMVANARFIESVGFSNIHHSNGRVMGGVTKYFPVAEKSSLAITARAGAKIHGGDLPEIMAMSLGGPYTIRGYRMNGVGSGNGFIMGSAELAVPLPFMDKVKFEFLKKIRFTMFVDAGHVYDKTISSILYDRPMSAITAGVGLKFYIPGAGPMSIDYGIPITHCGHYGRKSGYFTFGSSMMDMYNY